MERECKMPVMWMPWYASNKLASSGMPVDARWMLPTSVCHYPLGVGVDLVQGAGLPGPGAGEGAGGTSEPGMSAPGRGSWAVWGGCPAQLESFFPGARGASNGEQRCSLQPAQEQQEQQQQQKKRIQAAARQQGDCMTEAAWKEWIVPGWRTAGWWMRLTGQEDARAPKSELFFGP